MNSEIRQLEPKLLWNKFADLNAVPRPSKKEERVIAFIKKFGTNLGLTVENDAVGNVLIKKPATKGYEHKKTIVLQSHLDMVHQKNNDTIFDFNAQGIEMYIDGDWVRAKGTTLGADNGLGVATIMAILESDTIDHPPIEALFTIDEETGMTGAKNLKQNWLEGQILLNLDTEEDDEIGIGCAGGIDVTATRSYTAIPTSEDKTAYKITIKGLQGGHSGMDIHKGLGNANVIMNRLLYKSFKNYGLSVSEINGGGLRNAIPRESEALIVVDNFCEAAFKAETQDLIDLIKLELAVTEPKLTIKLEESELPTHVMELEVQEQLINALYVVHNGVYRMNPEITNLVDTSNNIARVEVKNEQIKVMCLTRSSIESSKNDLTNAITAGFELAGFEVKLSNDYPGWTPNTNSKILAVLEKLYKSQNGEAAKVRAYHAGLECGIIGNHYPEMDMISFGPDIKGAHSPGERVSIKSVKKYWQFMLNILKETP